VELIAALPGSTHAQDPELEEVLRALGVNSAYSPAQKVGVLLNYRFQHRREIARDAATVFLTPLVTGQIRNPSSLLGVLQSFRDDPLVQDVSRLAALGQVTSLGSDAAPYLPILKQEAMNDPWLKANLDKILLAVERSR